MFSDSLIESVKSQTELSDLIASYGVAMRTSGLSKMACCPFHNEKTPSLSINDSKGFYHCFGCGESGDAIKFVQRMEGLSFADAVRKLAERCGVKVEEERENPLATKRRRLYALMLELSKFYCRCLHKATEAEPARRYLVSRDISEDSQEAFSIGYAPVGAATIEKWAEKYGYSMDEMAEAGVVLPPRAPSDRWYHRFGGRLMFTIRDRQGRVVGFSGRQLVPDRNSGKYVNSPETVIFKKSQVLFAFDRAAANIAKSPRHEAIVCEGQIDTIRLHTSGFPTAVASQGTAFTEDHARQLTRVASVVTLVFDDDAAGHKATIRTACLFLAQGVPVKVVSLPGGEDPDSFIRKNGADAFRSLLSKSESIVSFQVRVETAKEDRPGETDARRRIAESVMTTISQCSDAVMREVMTSEASRLMGVSAAAISSCVSKLSSDAPALSRGSSASSSDSSPVPPENEIAFMRKILTHEDDAEFVANVRSRFTDAAKIHSFTADFIRSWLDGFGKPVDWLYDFARKNSHPSCPSILLNLMSTTAN